MAVRIVGSRGGTKRNPTIKLEMPESDGQKLLILCEFATAISEAMEFMGLKYMPVLRVLDGLKKGLAQAGVVVRR